MSQANEAPGMTLWRVGGKPPLNVHEGDRRLPMFRCYTPEDAARVVGLLNAALKRTRITREQAKDLLFFDRTSLAGTSLTERFIACLRELGIEVGE
jgi:hypothetical protein